MHKCKDCEASIQEDASRCEACQKNYFWCDSCSSETHQTHMFTPYGGETLCEQCYLDNYFRCESCEEDYPRDEMNICCDIAYCSSCYEGRDCCSEDSQPLRSYCSSDKYIKDISKGRTLTSPRIFGVEIEALYPESDNLFSVADRIDQSIGIAYDGSITGGLGIEFQTPKIAGVKGEQMIKSLCKELNGHNFWVNKSCGLHIHLDAPDIANDPASVKLLWIFYLVFDDILLSFLPASRRRNTYCQKLKDNYHLSEIVKAYDIEKLEQIWYRINNQARVAEAKQEHKHESSYNGINLHCLLANNHIEIRYHSGTLQADKILFWVQLHQRILDAIADRELDDNNLYQANDVIILNDKLGMFFDLLSLPKASQKYFLARVEKFNGKEMLFANEE